MSVLAMKDQLKLNPKSNIDRPFSMLFISARASRRFQGTNMCCRPERLRVIRVLPLFPREHTIDPPSGRLLGIHQAIGIVPSSQWEEPRYFGTLVGGTVDLTHVVHLVDLMESLLRTAYVISLVCRPVLRPTKLIQTIRAEGRSRRLKASEWEWEKKGTAQYETPQPSLGTCHWPGDSQGLEHLPITETSFGSGYWTQTDNAGQ
ncbi:conserved hypothetical protein [Coccidioides posadasii str. Silveira]|uniref:Uncharacterized protein n=1 Tax=Coccidioides posadasii (strain RMSCC 757 / Silveira) TaxID=443226 RepID=E9CXL8_COCPS|nr:conserved hypothetical protein [Coccidioides posadasii str. Silveira]